MADSRSRYIIRGGTEGRERLRILARVSRPATLSLLRQIGVRPGMRCLDVGCGGGDISFELARMVTPGGGVVGIDMDEVQIGIAQSEAKAQNLNIEFRVADLTQWEPTSTFDLAYARFILSHLTSPETTLAKIRNSVQPAGTIVTVDTNFAGLFSYPDSSAVGRFVDLYTQTLRRRGGDADVGLRLPELLTSIGLERVQMNVGQRAATTGEVKTLIPITAEYAADAIIAEGLASRAELEQLVGELYDFANDPHTVLSGPRIIEAWGYRPA